MREIKTVNKLIITIKNIFKQLTVFEIMRVLRQSSYLCI